MKVKDVRANWRDQTERASEVSRQLSLAGFAVIWVFRESSATGVGLPRFLYIPAVLLVLVLALDLAQYWYGARSWFTQAKLVEKLDADDEHRVPSSVNRPLQLMNAAKPPITLLSYFLIFGFIGWTLVAGPGAPLPSPAPSTSRN